MSKSPAIAVQKKGEKYLIFNQGAVGPHRVFTDTQQVVDYYLERYGEEKDHGQKKGLAIALEEILNQTESTVILGSQPFIADLLRGDVQDEE